MNSERMLTCWALTFESKAQLAQRRMGVRPRSDRPMVLSVRVPDGQVIDAGDANGHETLGIEFPVLVAVAAEPLTAVVMPLVREANRDAVLVEGPELLDQPVAQLTLPLAREERFDLVAALQKLAAVSPATVDRVREGNAARISIVPGVLGHARFLRRGLDVEGGKGRAGHGCPWAGAVFYLDY